MTKAEDKRLVLTVEEAAKLLGCGRTLCYELVRRGDLPSIRLGTRKIVIPRKALVRMLENPGGDTEEYQT